MASHLKEEDPGMHLKRLAVSGFRASHDGSITCEFPGRFSVLLGANGSGKTTICDAAYIAHPGRFPQLPPPTAAALGRLTPREVEIAYAFEQVGQPEGPLGDDLLRRGLSAPTWARNLERRYRLVRPAKLTPAPEPEGADQTLLLYLPANRNPLDELARREAQVLVEVLKSNQPSRRGPGSLASLRQLAERLLTDLAAHVLIESVEERVRVHLTALSSGVRGHHPFIAEKIAGRIVEYGTAVEAATWSMLWWARWLIPRESADVLSTDRRVTCSIDGILAAALIARRCRTPSFPIDPIAMNTVRIPSRASVRSRGSSRRV
jgi:hypothetical protein